MESVEKPYLILVNQPTEFKDPRYLYFERDFEVLYNISTFAIKLTFKM